ncbi:GGDEF domain-containing protein, partial [Kosakonia sp. H7A]
MRLQSVLSRLFPRSFSAKLLAVAFVGIHVPLLLLIVWLVGLAELDPHERWTVF